VVPPKTKRRRLVAFPPEITFAIVIPPAQGHSCARQRCGQPVARKSERLLRVLVHSSWRRGVHDGGRRERGDQVIQNIAGVAGAAGALAAAADGAWETELKAERLIPLHLGKRWWRP